MRFIYKITFVPTGEKHFATTGSEADTMVNGMLDQLVVGSINLETAIKLIEVKVVPEP